MEQTFSHQDRSKIFFGRIVRPRDRKLAPFYFAEKENYTFLKSPLPTSHVFLISNTKSQDVTFCYNNILIIKFELIIINTIERKEVFNSVSNLAKSDEIMAGFKFWNNQIRARFIQGK